MINKQLINLSSPASGGGNIGEEGLILHLDANDVDSYDGDGSEWVDITDHEYTPTTNVSEHFNTVTYIGDSATTNDISGVGFQPDLVWIKNRSASGGHWITDSIRGAGKALMSQSTGAEITSLPELMSSFNPDGFTVGYSANNTTNYTGYNYAAWCFKAGGAPSGSDKVSIDGTSYATMSAAELTAGNVAVDKLSVNTKLGFSILKFNSATGNDKTVAHGLGQKPELIISKVLVSGGWANWHKSFSDADQTYMPFTTSAAIDYGSSLWNYSNWGEDKIGFDNVLYGSNNDVIAYCFASKRGVSKVGSYTGTGTTNKIYTGFEPAFVMVKRSSTTGAGWYIVDNKRDTNTNKNKYLSADSAAAEASSGSSITFNRDGFTFDGSSYNTSSQTHIYYAVAKNTNEASLIPDTDLELHLDAASFPEYGEPGYFPTPFTWIDSSVNGNNGTITGATFDSELGNWLEFNGGGEKVNITASSPVTLEIWVKPDATSGIDALAGHDSITSNYIYWNSGDLTVNGVIFTSLDKVTDWTHIALVESGSDLLCYKNGNLIQTLPGALGTYNLLGARTAGTSQYLDGKIGQVRMYSSALTQDQIRQNYNFTKPSYPNGYDGTLEGLTSSDWNSDGYFTFDGYNDYLHPVGFRELYGNFTFHMKFKATHTSGENSILASTTNNFLAQEGIVFSVQPTGTFFIGFSDGSTKFYEYTSAANTILNNTWHDFVVVQSLSGYISVYVDGVEINKATVSNFTESSYRDLLIGTYGEGYTPQRFKGSVEKIKIYDKALTSTEIAAL